MKSQQVDQLPGSPDPFALARRMKTPVWVYDTDNNRIAYANEAACAIWQADSEEELKARDLSIGMSSTVADRLIQFQADFIENDSEFSEYWTIFPRGVPVTVKILCSGFVMPDGRMATLAEMIGAGEKEPETLRSIEALLHTDVMIALFSMEGAPLHLNPAARKAMPQGVLDFEGLFCEPEDFLRMKGALEESNECQIVAKMNTSAGTKWIDLNVKGCLDAATGDSALLVTGVDVSELKITRDKARFMASRDQLTGCYNRAFMQMEQDKIIADCESGDARHALLFLDIDRFKLVNDSFGHEVGDTILQTFALRAQAQLHENDILARMGGMSLSF